MNAPAKIGPVYHEEFEQGSGLWMKARCGLLTASEFGRILTPTLKIAENVKSRAHLWEIAAQRISGYVEPQYISDAMLRGHEDEIRARDLYTERFAPVEQVGFVTNSNWGFTLGCSPDGLVGDDGLIEVKSRCQKYQVQTLCEWQSNGTIPEEYMLQIQGQLLITDRKFCDFLSYSGGLPTKPMRVEADFVIQDAIVDAAAKFEARINEVVATYAAAVADGIPTERTIEMEMHL